MEVQVEGGGWRWTVEIEGGGWRWRVEGGGGGRRWRVEVEGVVAASTWEYSSRLFWQIPSCRACSCTSLLPRVSRSSLTSEEEGEEEGEEKREEEEEE